MAKKRKKGRGFLGSFQRLDDPSFVSSEISIGVPINGKETEIPTMVPSLNKKEVKSLLSSNSISQSVVNKAVSHAKKRTSQGKSVFAGNNDRIEANRKNASTGMVRNPKFNKSFSKKENALGFRKL